MHHCADALDWIRRRGCQSLNGIVRTLAGWVCTAKSESDIVGDERLPLESFIILTLAKTAVAFAVLMTNPGISPMVRSGMYLRIFRCVPATYRVGSHGLLQSLADMIKLLN